MSMKLNNIGLEIIRKYDPEAEINPAHDQIFVGDYEKSYTQMTAEEIETMDADGWFNDEGAWSHFC